MRAEIISIGTELLLGDIVDTNSAYIASGLTELGFDINYISTVGDNKKRIIKTIKQALKRADIIITTGGLGPTTDDITRSAVAESTGNPLYKDDKLFKSIKNYFESRNRKFTDNNYRQAFLPQGAEPIINNGGTAPGILLEFNNHILISLPGVPEEMKAMFKQQVFPYLKQKTGFIIKSKTLKFYGIGESALETKLQQEINNQSNPTMALLASKGVVSLRITAKADSHQKADKMIKTTENKIREKAGEYIFTTKKKSLPELVADLLKKNELTISIAESCTGGLIGSKLTDIPGSSQYFTGGIIAYSNIIKEKELGISKNILKEYGAVSEQIAKEMARGIKEEFNTNIGIGITGIAGPGGGTSEKPVGLVYISIATCKKTYVYKLDLKGNRKNNKIMSANYVFYYLYRYLKNRGKN